MNTDLLLDDPRYSPSPSRMRPRGPRFALILLIIMAIMSVILAITVAYILI